ncbi:MAG: hypothetical protein ABIE74_02925 [Pseudomonadota bacterium]
MHSQRQWGIILPLFIAILISSTALSLDENFSISIIGTTHFQDVAVIKNGLANLKGRVLNIYPAQENKGLVILRGTYIGDIKNLLYDIRSLSIDRFNVEVVQSDTVLNVNLRKLTSDIPSNE